MIENVRLKDIVINYIGDPNTTIESGTRIEGDLRIVGEDALELFELINAEFELDMTGFHFNKYFSDEGFDPLGVSILIKKLLGRPIVRKSKHAITIGDFDQWIKRGYWKEPAE